MAQKSLDSISKASPLINVDDLLQKRILQDAEKPLVAFPKSHLGLDDFELFSARDIDFFTENAAQELLRSMAIVPEVSNVDTWHNLD